MCVQSHSEAKPGVQLTLKEPPTPVLPCSTPASPMTVSALRTSCA